MVVKELMTTHICFVKEDASLQAVAQIMQQHDIGFVPVCNVLGELSGVITDRDLVIHSLCAQKDWCTAPVIDCMTTELITISPDTEIHDAALVLSRHGLHRLPVVYGKRLIGVLSVSDLAKKSIYLAEVGEIIGSITSKSVQKNKYGLA